MYKVVNDNKLIYVANTVGYAKKIAEENKDWAFMQWIFKGNKAYACREVDREDWHSCLKVDISTVLK